MKTKIKICGIKHAELAYAAACAGADFIGLIFVPSSHRAVNVRTAVEIAAAARLGGAKPVAVFTQAAANSMLAICAATEIDWVQLHGANAREEQRLLPSSFHRIYAQTVSPQGGFHLDNEVERLDIKRDYLLFDGLQPGSGKVFDWQNFTYQGNFPWFLSGGLTATNVGTAIDKLHPQVVDISSGVENAAGEKTLSLIKQFIQAVY